MAQKTQFRREGVWVKAKKLNVLCDAGCTKQQLRNHLESQFVEGMSWENHGEWEIDHITPVAFFDLSIREEFLAACHWSNLQPKWGRANRVKSSKVCGLKLLSKTKWEKPLPKSYLEFESAEAKLVDGDTVIVLTRSKAQTLASRMRAKGRKVILKKMKLGMTSVRAADRPKTLFTIGNWQQAA